LRNPERKREVWEDMKQISQWMSQDGSSQPVGDNRR
jgi:hypothetical protein